MTATLLPPGQSALDLAFPNLSSVLRVETAMCASQLAADYLRAGETPTTWHQGKKREIALMLGNAGYLPILQRLESCLNELTTVGIGAAHLKRINTLGLLAGPREKCLSGIAEIVGLAWLSRTGALLPGASSEIAKSESPHAHTKSVDGSGASTYQRWEVIRPYLSAFLYLNDSRGEAFLVKNPYCRKQISPTLEGNLVNAGAVIVT